MKNVSKTEYPIYKGENGGLYVFETNTGKLWTLEPAKIVGWFPGTPLPEQIDTIGELTMIGMHKVEY